MKRKNIELLEGQCVFVEYNGKREQWYEQDPVDDWERQRNDVIQKWQGNRNPFIDHPDWVNTIW